MVVIEVLGVVVLLALAVVATAGLYIGLLGITGSARLVRCDRCRHFGLTSVSEPLRSCVRCRHGRLYHPLYALHHIHDQTTSDKQGVGAGH